MNPKVLLVDDEERFRTTLSKMLKAHGLEVTDLGSGLEALEELKRNSYDVVVLDVRMPEMDGIAVLAEMKKLDPLLEVIMLTGHANMEAATKIMWLGAYEFLLKPCAVEDLIDKIEFAFERKTTREAKKREEED
jgi:DNA-binding NtrC family response regulator